MKSLSTAIMLFLCGICFVATPNNAIEAQTPDETPYWYVISYQVPWSKVDSLQSMIQRYTVPVVEEAKKQGSILDYRVLRHHTGDEWNIVMMTLYPNWQAMSEGNGFGQAFETIEPQQSVRDSVYAIFGWIMNDVPHKDNIYRDLTYQK